MNVSENVNVSESELGEEVIEGMKPHPLGHEWVGLLE